MKIRILSAAYVTTLQNLLTSFRELWPYAILGLGGILTVLWAGLIIWIPLRLITSVISIAVSDWL